MTTRSDDSHSTVLTSTLIYQRGSIDHQSQLDLYQFYCCYMFRLFGKAVIEQLKAIRKDESIFS